MYALFHKRKTESLTVVEYNQFLRFFFLSVLLKRVYLLPKGSELNFSETWASEVDISYRVKVLKWEKKIAMWGDSLILLCTLLAYWYTTLNRSLLINVVYGAYLTNICTFLDRFVFLTLKNKREQCSWFLGYGWVFHTACFWDAGQYSICFLCEIYEAKILGEVMICSNLILMWFL